MLKKSKIALILACSLMLTCSNVAFANPITNENPQTKVASEKSIYTFTIDGYTFKYENAPQQLKDEYDKTCNELGITPSADSEIFVPADEMQRYSQTYSIDDTIATYDTFTIEYFNTYYRVSGSKSYTVATSKLVGYGHTTSGNPVHLVQLLLKKIGTPVSIDSIFGSDTYNKVRSFQSRYGLSADGIVGMATWDKFASVGNIS